MGFFATELERRGALALPAGGPVVWRQALEAALYGCAGADLGGVEVRLELRTERTIFAGTGCGRLYDLVLDGLPCGDGSYRFPLEVWLPWELRPDAWFLLWIRFSDDHLFAPCPLEELVGRGFAIAAFDYQSVLPDSHDGDFTGGLAARLWADGRRREGDWGRIGIWAWAASRALDGLKGIVDKRPVAVIGHSRLGKTALWAAAQDTRFAAACVNNSGVGGAAMLRGGTGEKVRDFLRLGSWDWFVPAFCELDGREDEIAADSQLALALVAPRRVILGNAWGDYCQDPGSELLAAVAAAPAYERAGVPGLICPERLPGAGESFTEGRIAYFLRAGGHALLRGDWLRYADILAAPAES